MIGLELQGSRKALAECSQHIGEVTAEVGDLTLQAEVEHHVDQRVAQAVLARIIRSVRWWIGVDMRRRNRRPNKQTAIMEIRPVQYLARYRIEECLRAFWLLVVDQQCDVVTLDFFPTRVIDACASELAFQARHRFRHSAIVEVDAILRGVGNREPVSCLEVLLCRARAIAKEGIVTIEALQRGLGNGTGFGDGVDAYGVQAGQGMGGRDHRWLSGSPAAKCTAGACRSATRDDGGNGQR